MNPVAQTDETGSEYAHVIVETLREPLLILDGALKVQFANPAFYRTFDVIADETLGRHVYDLGEGQWDIPALRALLREVIDHDRPIEDSRVDHEFATIASHDLQEPLRKIVAFAERLEGVAAPVLDEQGLDSLKRMLDAGHRMRVMVNDLLAYSRVSRSYPEIEPVPLEKVIAGVLSDLQVPLLESGAQVEVESLAVVNGDASLLRVLVQNLVANAIKYRVEDRPPRSGSKPNRTARRFTFAFATGASVSTKCTSIGSSIPFSAFMAAARTKDPGSVWRSAAASRKATVGGSPRRALQERAPPSS